MAAPASLVVRATELADVDAVARIAHERNGGALADHVAGVTRALSPPPGAPEEILLTALVDSAVAGYAKAAVFVPPTDAPPNCAPAGWYLTGVTVAPAMRRRGIALELTRARMALVARRADCVHYFANARNRASIDLHARLGFVEVTRDFWYPRTTFAGGVGVLFRAESRRGRS